MVRAGTNVLTLVARGTIRYFVDTKDEGRVAIQVRLEPSQLKELDAYVSEAAKRVGSISRSTAIRYLLEFALKEKRRAR
jgi:hypothetical protein